MTRRMLLLNGSVRGAEGNTAALLQRAGESLTDDWQREALSLAEYSGSIEALAEQLRAADAFLVGSGVYWGSWGSPLQRFLEVMTSYELSACFLGKPAGAIISADSVGGLDVAQRLLGAFSLLGCVVPPLSTVVISRVAQAASSANDPDNDDVWQVDDLAIVVRNLSLASALRVLPWATWPVRKLTRLGGQYPTHGVLEGGLRKFV